jgi:phosphatidylglycerol---prolipoprotein diacylglyceryl transferase
MGIAAGLSHGTVAVLGYIVLNIDPILLRLGPLAIHWYGLAYVVAILMGFGIARRWAATMGVHEEQLWNVFLWTAIAGLIGGRLYFVVQQPDLWSHYILQPINIIAVWDGGMAFFGAIFLGGAALFILAPKYGFSPWLALDGGAVFAAVGQIFGRFGNIINGDIVGYGLSTTPINIPADVCAKAPCVQYVADPHFPWYATVYLNPGAFHPQGIPYMPAAVFEIGLNLVMLFIIWQVRLVLPRVKAGYLFTLYLAMYAISQIVVFFWRDNVITPFLGIDVLKQAQWTGIFTLIFAVPTMYLLARHYSAPWRYSAAHPVPWSPAEVAAADSKPNGAKPGGTVAQLSATTLEPAPAADVSAVDLPPWSPAKPAGGALRNMFTHPSQGTTL